MRDGRGGQRERRAVTDFAPGLERFFAGPPAEHRGLLPEAEGQVPRWLHGTWYQNGPGRFARGGFAYTHWLDGDGMVCALRFADGGACFTSRWVRSTKLAAEEEAERPIFRTFGTAFPGDRLKRGIMLESPVNVSVYPFAGALLAFGEQGLPWRLQPDSLATCGVFSAGGALSEVTPFAAHPKADPASGELFNFGVAYTAGEPALHLFRFDAAGCLRNRWRSPLPYACTVHDFALSRRYAVFHLGPYLLDMAAVAGAGLAPVQALRWEPERGARFLVIARDTGEIVASVPAGQGYCLHLINAFERGERLYVDVLLLDRPIYDQYQPLPDLFVDVAPGRPARFVIDLGRHEIAERRDIPYECAPDFATIDPRRAGTPCDTFWTLGIAAAGRTGRKFFDTLARGDWASRSTPDLYRAPAGSYLCGDPVFVPAPRSAGGAVICQSFDARRGSGGVAIFDAFDLAKGPVARVWTPGASRTGFHAAFVPAPAPLDEGHPDA
jgi:all-trans-8'-apo-beta-carotenal 15,15'-oxygenase